MAISLSNYRTKPPRTRLWRFSSAAAVEHGNGGAAAHIHGAAADTRRRSNRRVGSRKRLSSFRGAASEHGTDQPQLGNANPGNNGLGHQSLELPSQAAAHAAVEIPSHGIDRNGGAAAHIHSAVAEHSSKIDTVGTTISDSVSSSFRGATSGHVNDQPHFENANPGNDGLGGQSLELPSQAASHAAVKNPLAAAIEDANGGHAAHIHGAAAEHSSTIDTAEATVADSDSSTFRGAASEHANDQPHFGHANPGNNGLGHQSLELPSQAAAHAAVEIPLATAIEDANGGHAAHIHGAAAEHSSKIDIAGATVADSDSSSFRGAASEHVNDQPHFGHANPGNNGLGHQSLEWLGQAASHAAVEIPLATAVEDANGGHAAHIHGAAAEHSSTIDTAEATVAA